MNTTYANRRPESPKGQCFVAWEAKGPDAARKLAEQLSIPNHKIEKWLKPGGWQATAAAHKASAAKADKAVKSEPAKAPKSKPNKARKPAPKKAPAKAGAKKAAAKKAA